MIKKRKGESGSPWRMPRVGEKGLEGTPLTKIEKKAEEVSFMIHSIQSALNPKAERMDCMYFQPGMILRMEIYFKM
jgi:hypothetical protein